MLFLDLESAYHFDTILMHKSAHFYLNNYSFIMVVHRFGHRPSRL
jgi:hypothetical protein